MPTIGSTANLICVLKNSDCSIATTELVGVKFLSYFRLIINFICRFKYFMFIERTRNWDV